jgi:BirA family biotin operon repressor/biotin-[acetyl-CoA-carboxylase] ligase
MSLLEEWNLETRRLGRRVLVFDVLDSTNTQAGALAHNPANDGIVVLAEEQTAGRGQQGRCWHCPRGAGILMSVLLFPPQEIRRPVLLVAWASNSVCETIRRRTGLEATIKWPNDVLVHGHKVCGILIEQGRGTVVGLGLNVNQTAKSLVEAGLPGAGSLAQFMGQPLDRKGIACALIEQLDKEYQGLLQGELARLESSWKRRIGLLGKEVLVECPDATHRGLLTALGWEGAELGTSCGAAVHIRPEVVKHITALE